MRKTRWVTGFGGAVFVGVAAVAAQAGTITFTGTQVEENGTGFGSVLNLLTVQAQGNGTTEYGSVTWDGTNDVLGGDASNTSETRSVADIFGATGNTDVGLIFNINQQGSDTSLFLNDFELLVFDELGALLDTFLYTAPGGGLHLDIDQQGTGGSGWLFRVTGLGSLIDTSTNRFGMRILSEEAITQVNDGPENFYITSIPSAEPPPPPTAVPLPPAALAGLLTLGGAGLIARLRRRRSVV